jgi:hypothetical protein
MVVYRLPIVWDARQLVEEHFNTLNWTRTVHARKGIFTEQFVMLHYWATPVYAKKDIFTEQFIYEEWI